MAEELKLETQLSAGAEAALAELRKKVGSGRVQGPHRDGGDHELVLTRSNGKRVYLYGRTPSDVLEQAKRYVEQTTKRRA